MSYSDQSLFLTVPEAIDLVMASLQCDAATAARDIVRAGREGAFKATRRLPQSKARRPVPPEDWERSRPDRLGEFPEIFEHVWIARTDMERLWPGARTALRQSARFQCAQWIQRQITAGIDWDGRKDQACAAARSEIEGLTQRGFLAVWAKHAPPAWRRPGARNNRTG